MRGKGKRQDSMAENEADGGRETGMVIHEPPSGPFTGYRDAAAAVARLEEIFETNTAFLRDAFQQFLAGDIPQGRVRACYPEIRLVTETHGRVDSRLAYGFVSGPGVHSTSVTRPDLFRDYLLEQVELLIRNHEVPVEVGVSDLPIPLHFAFYEGTYVEGGRCRAAARPLRDVVRPAGPDDLDDDIVNGISNRGRACRCRWRRSPRRASTIRCTACSTTRQPAPSHFQNFILFTNYQFYMDEFCQYARDIVAGANSGYTGFRRAGQSDHPAGESEPQEGVHPRAAAADAGLSPDEGRPLRHHHGQYRRRPVQRQDDHRPYRGAAAACLADARPLRRPAQQPESRRLRACPRLCARGQRLE
jgi:AMP nucleosidase